MYFKAHTELSAKYRELQETRYASMTTTPVYEVYRILPTEAYLNYAISLEGGIARYDPATCQGETSPMLMMEQLPKLMTSPLLINTRVLPNPHTIKAMANIHASQQFGKLDRSYETCLSAQW